MKKIGILGGMSPESTCEYYKLLTRGYNRIKGGISSPRLIIESLDLQEITNWMDNQDYDSLLKRLLESARILVLGGAEVIIMATNTPHIVFDRLEKEVKVPMLSIMDATASKIVDLGLKKVGLLGTRFTMKTTYYQKAFLKYDLEIIVPNEKDQEIIDQIIWEELVYHKINPLSRNRYLEVISHLQSSGAEGIILGCTEIPLLIQQADCHIPVFDTTSIHVNAVLEYALSNSKED
ncbi:MAG: aspartate/glutamate racemase family protein [Candidatus Thorarchaeota archaeon]